jgi:hypothetical protein
VWLRARITPGRKAEGIRAVANRDGSIYGLRRSWRGVSLGLRSTRIASKSDKVQYEIVGVLGLLAMFTHVNAFWVAGLLLALIDIPDFSTPLRRISGAVDKIAAKGGIALLRRNQQVEAGKTLLPQKPITPVP